MKWILLTLISTSVFAQIKYSQGKFAPFTFKDQNFKSLLIKSAQELNIRLVIGDSAKGLDEKVFLKVNNPMTKLEMLELLSVLASERGLTLNTDENEWWVMHSRDMRYFPNKIVKKGEFPKSDEFILYYHQLKNPLSHDVSRNMRPFLSHYGRVISFGDGHSIILSDQANNVDRLIKIMDVMDKEVAVKNKVRHAREKSKLKMSDYQELKRKYEEAMVENKILREKAAPAEEVR